MFDLIAMRIKLAIRGPSLRFRMMMIEKNCGCRNESYHTSLSYALITAFGRMIVLRWEKILIESIELRCIDLMNAVRA